MKHTITNKLLILLYTLIVGLTFFMLIERQKELWEKLALLALAVIMVLLYIKNTNRIKYFMFVDDVLIISQTFSKQKQYSLKDVSGWTENHYHLLDFKTGREIVLKMKEGTKINLFEKNSKDFEKLSDYLSENFPEAFETKNNNGFTKWLKIFEL
ncbi:hypothetical protein IRZ71_15480 [Flavobacterium sp. ANB]|uniref:hypothetical protein n=1 Tax=unclassified Flavobacterium TaxID=196869 RepID=UPI0012B92376|nr:MULTISPECIES: hypothetical protein [unclassified Flavobacterium]MBF4517765.1 hypothetical protein [Flavobacterium sp. ANB]MTD70492.1 hypothetical protein [Flavobacterium sp. LC2016-13]